MNRKRYKKIAATGLCKRHLKDQLPMIDNSAVLIENQSQLQESARSFMQSHGIKYDGEFKETSVDEIITFAGKGGDSRKICWLKCRCLINSSGKTGLCITFGAHHTDLPDHITNTFWESTDSAITEEEKQKNKERIEEGRKKALERAKEEEKIADAKADWCCEKLSKASPKGFSPYFEKKNISVAEGIRFEIHKDYRGSECIEEQIALIPLKNIQGKIRSIQEIYPTKRLFNADDKQPRDKNTQGRYSGCFFTFGQLKDGEKICLAEGYATASTIFYSNFTTILMCVSRGNLLNVGHEIKIRYPNSEIIICGDDDVDTKGNPGRTDAEKCARELKCKVVFPVFPIGKEKDENGEAYKDFNDLMLIAEKEEVKRQIEQAKYAAGTEDGKEETPTIEINSGDIHRITSQAEKILIECDSGIYQRGGQLVRIITAKSKPNKATKLKKDDKPLIKRAVDSLLIMEADPIHLCEVLSKLVRWVKFDERSKQFKQKDCPDRVASTLVSRKEWNLPVLCGIIQAPTLRPDGSILEKPGYDDSTGLFFNPGKTDFPTIPLSPNRDDAIAALDQLLSLLSGFPFDNEESKSVAISAILTGLARKSISTAPLHGFTAPKMGTGKSLLADIVGLIATGKPNCAIPQADNEAEEKKRLLSVLSEGDPIICYDNIERPFGSPALCSVLTQGEFKDRLLGVNRSLSVPTNATFLATGNNLTFIGDISTRVILCRLDPRCERPEERSFSIDLKKYIPSNRGELVKAGLTILRAYHVAGRPKQNIPQFGRFEEWSDLIRSSLLWLGMTDPCTSRKEVENEDPIRVLIGGLFTAWYAAFGDLTLKANSVIEKAKNLPELLEVLKDVTSNGKGEISSVKLGQILNKYNKRIEGGFRIEKMTKYQNADTWRVVKC